MLQKDSCVPDNFINTICKEINKNYSIDPQLFEKHNVKRGLRNADGTGVVAGLTTICNVHGYLINEGERMPIDGELIYRGINIKEIVKGCQKEKRFGFEESAYLLLFGTLPNKDQLAEFNTILSECRQLPFGFTEDVILRAPSKDIMNSLQRSVLAMYAYDKEPEDLSLQNLLRQSMELIAIFPAMVVNAYQVKKRFYDKDSMYFHFPQGNLSTAENFLYTMRNDNKFTEEEARLLDLSLMLHAEHGGGNNSAFSARVLSSSGTDTYSAISAAIGSLKGPKHGGANAKVEEMFNHIKSNVEDWKNEDELSTYLEKLIRKKAADRSGLVYGMGHAVYTISDPRAIILKENARALAEKNNMLDEFLLIDAVERLAPNIFCTVKNDNKVISANVDMYSGFVYKMLGIPQELFTPLFAIARITGWCAHRIEEVATGGRIIRPAYKAVAAAADYVPLSVRE